MNHRRFVGVIAASILFGLGFFIRSKFFENIWISIFAHPIAAPFVLVESSKESGLINVHQKFKVSQKLANIAPMLAALAGAAVAVTDYNRDGWMDVYVTNAAKGSMNKLFRNNHDGTFTDVAKQAGIADVNRGGGSFDALFFDYDNDGYDDLLLSAYPCLKLFHNNGNGTFTDVTKKSGLHHCGNTYAMNVIDYDNDGYLDVIVADYYKPVNLLNPQTTKFMWNGTYADNGGPIVVFHNNRNGTFSSVKGNLGIKSRGWTWAIGIYHLLGSLYPDIFFATDFGPSQLYQNLGHGLFKNRSEFINRDDDSAMSAEAADLDNDEIPFVSASGIYEPSSATSLYGNSLWEFLSPHQAKDIARERRIAHCGWSWGQKFIDLDNDGLLDLIVANGFISAGPKDYRYQAGILGQGMGDLSTNAKLWPPMKHDSFDGYQQKCVFHNLGKSFEDVTDSVGLVHDFSDGRAVAAIDALNNGRVGFLIANVGQPIHFYLNETKNSNHWIGFTLQGTQSNRDGFGAIIRVKNGPTTMSRELEPANGLMSESDSRLHFGLGKNPNIREIDVLWPSGIKQRFRGKILKQFKVDHYHLIQEPRVQK